jgi:hypothetical protein
MPKKSRKDVLAEIERRLNLTSILSDEEKAIIQKKAKEHARATKKEAAEKAYLHALIKEEERADKPDEQMVDILLDLPEHAPFIRIDNRVWFHGVLYEVEMSVFRTMIDMQARMWEQEEQTRGISKVRSARNLRIGPSNPSPHMGAITTLANLRSGASERAATE